RFGISRREEDAGRGGDAGERTNSSPIGYHRKRVPHCWDKTVAQLDVERTGEGGGSVDAKLVIRRARRQTAKLQVECAGQCGIARQGARDADDSERRAGE